MHIHVIILYKKFELIPIKTRFVAEEYFVTVKLIYSLPF